MPRPGWRRRSSRFEPLGAAYWHARDLRRDETVLVADFGGGTSDFALLHFAPGPDGLEAEALGHGGCGVAGDSFDFRLIDHVISPRLGKGASYRSLEKILPLPAYFHASFAQWHQISWLKTAKTLGELRRFAEVSDRGGELEALAELIELDLGFELYQAVGAVKAALSSAPEARLSFKRAGVAIEFEREARRFRDLDRARPRPDRRRAGRHAGDGENVPRPGGRRLHDRRDLVHSQPARHFRAAFRRAETALRQSVPVGRGGPGFAGGRPAPARR